MTPIQQLAKAAMDKQAGSYKSNLGPELAKGIANSRPQNKPGFIPPLPANPPPGAAQVIRNLPALEGAMKAFRGIGILPPEVPAKAPAKKPAKGAPAAPIDATMEKDSSGAIIRAAQKVLSPKLLGTAAAAMPKWLRKGSNPKSLSLGAPKNKNLLKLRKTFPVVDKQPDWRVPYEIEGAEGAYSPRDNLATVYADAPPRNLASKLLLGDKSIGSKSYANTKRHEVLHGLLENANAEAMRHQGLGFRPFKSRLPQAGTMGGRLEQQADGIIRSQRDLIHNALPWMMRPAHRAKRVSNWFQKKMTNDRNARWAQRDKLFGPDWKPAMKQRGLTLDKWNRMAGYRSRWSIPHDVMKGVERLLDEAGAQYGGYKGRPIRGALAAANSTFGPTGIAYGLQAHRGGIPLGLTQTAGSLGGTAGAGIGLAAGTSAAYDAIKENLTAQGRADHRNAKIRQAEWEHWQRRRLAKNRGY